MSNVIELNDSNFDDEVVKSDKPVLVDFWAEWCGPCKMIAPSVEKISEEYSNKLKVGKLDVDANQTSAAQQNVMSIPTLAIFKGGELVAQQVGALSKTQLTEFIESNLQKTLDSNFQQGYYFHTKASLVTSFFQALNLTYAINRIKKNASRTAH